MNSDVFKGQWKQLKGDIKMRWNQLTDDDIETIDGAMEKLEGRLQERYGWEKERVAPRDRDLGPRPRRLGAEPARSESAPLLGLPRLSEAPDLPNGGSGYDRRVAARRPPPPAVVEPSEDDRYFLEGPHSRRKELLILFRAVARLHPRLPRPALRRALA